MKDFITQIEGHAKLHINWKANRAIIEILEGERLFEAILCGRPAKEAPWITSRICGVCPIAHNLASLKAAETALNIKINKETLLLRELLSAAQMIQSHTLHLFFLALPDYLEIESALRLPARYFKLASQLKEVSDELAYVVGGRRVHPTSTEIGGFKKSPSIEKIKRLRKNLVEAIPAAKSTIKLFQSFKYPALKNNLVFLAQADDWIISNRGAKIKANDYKKIIGEEIKAYSTAKFGKYKKQRAMVGALARLNLQNHKLNPRAKKFFKECGVDFQNPFHNNIAQAIEILQFLEDSIEIIDRLLVRKKTFPIKSKIQSPKPKIQKSGIGLVEAPRGILIHDFSINKNGAVTKANIVTPTVINLGSMEENAQILVQQTKNLSRQKQEKLIEMLIRAYDPCLTCSVH